MFHSIRSAKKMPWDPEDQSHQEIFGRRQGWKVYAFLSSHSLIVAMVYFIRAFRISVGKTWKHSCLTLNMVRNIFQRPPWLPVKRTILYKFFLTTVKAHSGLMPFYMHKSVVTKDLVRSMRSNAATSPSNSFYKKLLLISYRLSHTLLLNFAGIEYHLTSGMLHHSLFPTSNSKLTFFVTIWADWTWTILVYFTIWWQFINIVVWNHAWFVRFAFHLRLHTFFYGAFIFLLNFLFFLLRYCACFNMCIFCARFFCVFVKRTVTSGKVHHKRVLFLFYFIILYNTCICICTSGD